MSLSSSKVREILLRRYIGNGATLPLPYNMQRVLALRRLPSSSTEIRHNNNLSFAVANFATSGFNSERSTLCPSRSSRIPEEFVKSKSFPARSFLVSPCTKFLGHRFFASDNKGDGDDEKSQNNVAEEKTIDAESTVDTESKSNDATDASGITSSGKHQRQEEKLTPSVPSTSGNKDGDDDPFGLHFDDGPDGLGPHDKFPPKYIRDLSTGQVTGDVQKEVSQREMELLEMSEEERLEELTEQVQATLSTKEAQDDLVKHVLRNDALKAKEIRASHPDRHKWEMLQKKYRLMLQQKEKLLQKDYEAAHGDGRKMSPEQKKYHDLLETHDLHDSQLDPPTDDGTTNASEPNSSKLKIPEEWAHPDEYPSNPWATENLAWVAHDVNEPARNSFESADYEFMPPELTQGRNKRLNRRQATPIPKHLLSHNNLHLLRKFMTPGGQIMPRSQTRLGAKDQRKVAKSIRRARAMGIIPVIGEWKVHDHGNLMLSHEELESSKKEWEKVFEKANLIGPNAKQYKMTFTEEEAEILTQRGRDYGILGEDGNYSVQDELYKAQARQIGIKLVDKKKK